MNMVANNAIRPLEIQNHMIADDILSNNIHGWVFLHLPTYYSATEPGSNGCTECHLSDSEVLYFEFTIISAL